MNSEQIKHMRRELPYVEANMTKSQPAQQELWSKDCLLTELVDNFETSDPLPCQINDWRVRLLDKT